MVSCLCSTVTGTSTARSPRRSIRCSTSTSKAKPSTTQRSPLSLAVSFDDGVTWRDFLVVEELSEGERGELSYPAMIQDADGDLQITYTWNRRRIRHATVPLGLIPGAP